MSKRIRQQRRPRFPSLFKLGTLEPADLFTTDKYRRDLKLVATVWRPNMLGHIWDNSRNAKMILPATREDIELMKYWADKRDWACPSRETEY